MFPHPLMVGVAKVPRVKSGSVRATSSLAFNGALNSKEYDTDDAADVTGLANVRLLCESTGRSTAVDVTIAVAAMSATDAKVTAAVLVFRFEAWAAAGVVMPVATVTAHCLYTSRVALAAVSVKVAVAVPILLPVAVNVVLSHPLVVILPSVPKPKDGSSRSMVSAA